MSSKRVLSCCDVELGYSGSPVLQHLNFHIDEGDYLCILGENGTGKSTLMQALLGIIKPISGSIELGEGFCKRDIGYLKQQSDIQRDFPASVEEIVLHGCLNRGSWKPFYSKAQKQLARETMEKAGVAHLAHRSYQELSGGQQQRTLLARALCAAQKILFLDEPTAGLDSQAQTKFYHIIRQLNEQEGITIIIISHDIDTTLRDAKRVLYLGKNRFFGDRRDYSACLDSCLICHPPTTP